VDSPSSVMAQQESQPVPSTMRFSVTGVDPDTPGEPGAPVYYRMLYKLALLPDNSGYVQTRLEFEEHVDELVSFADSSWSAWMPYPADPAGRIITFPNQQQLDGWGRVIHYLFALQVIDTTGAVSLERRYGYNVANVYVQTNLSPTLTVFETDLGMRQFSGTDGIATYDIPGGAVFDFQWLGTADEYGYEVVLYRYGYDVADPADPYDPGWAVSPGNMPLHRHTGPVSFASGIHTLTIQCWDDLDQQTMAQFVLSVVPVPDPASQLPLLLVDDVYDRTSYAWPGQQGTPLDNDYYRDAFWMSVLTSPDGVLGFDPQRDIVDTEEQALSYRDLVAYRNVIWTTRFHASSFVSDEFKPLQREPGPYNWLAAYDRNVGGLLLAGERALNGFLEDANWMIPWFFAAESEFEIFGGDVYRVGFGELALPDGSDVSLGTLRFPSRHLGLATLDQVTPIYPLYGHTGPGSTGDQARSPDCAGVKALVLDPDFALSHAIGVAFPDTIFTEASIDWRDEDPLYRDQLSSFFWGKDEIYDANMADRPTLWMPEECPDAPCVEAMFRGYSRFDWVDDLHAAGGDPDWPEPYYSQDDLPTVCGQYAFDPSNGRVRTTGQITGFMSHKNYGVDPSSPVTLILGFDPYRFDHDAIGRALQWVFHEHFGLDVRGEP
jgi:hypothetical protein